VIQVGLLRWFAHRYRVAIVAEGDLLLAFATPLLLFREGHGYHGQHGNQHHRSHHAKNRHTTAHTNPTPLCGWVCAMSLVGNIAGKGLLPVPLVTLAHSSLTTGVRPRICQVAIFCKAPRESMAGNLRKLFRASHPCSTYDPIARPPIHTSAEHKGCVLVSTKPGADFSRGCAG
jgi:hypothetical protein